MEHADGTIAEVRAVLDETNTLVGTLKPASDSFNEMLTTADTLFARYTAMEESNQSEVVMNAFFWRACEELTGYTHTEVAERAVWDFLIPERELDTMREIGERLMGASPTASLRTIG